MFYIRQNDTSPALMATVADSDGTPVNVTGASVEFHMRLKNAAATTVSAAGEVVDGAAGTIKYQWLTNDTGVVGTYEGEFQITYADTTIETFPNKGYIAIKITEEIA